MSFGVEGGLWMLSCEGSWRVLGKWYEFGLRWMAV